MKGGFQSKNGALHWSSFPPSDKQCMLGAERERSPTRYAMSHVDCVKSTFELFLQELIERIVLELTNKEER